MVAKFNAAQRTALLVSLAILGVDVPAQAQQIDTPPASPADQTASVENVTVTASRVDLIGVADNATQGSVTQEELALRPVYRVGQLLESIPGLTVTIHSGEGKANQYLARGENLDHGIDMANFIDDMPINRPTNAHGQGYSDLNFIIPQLLQGIDYTKGPYEAAIGDFGGVASAHMRLLDEMPNQISTSLGTLGAAELFAGGTSHFDDGSRLLGALDLSHVDGPFTYPDNYRKSAGALRYSQGTDADGYSLTTLYFKGQGRNTTDQPLRAVQEGLISDYGSLDPSDGNKSERWSLSGHYGNTGDGWRLAASAYVIHSTMTLWNNFTHFLNDPINGDQEQQDETRTTVGGAIAYTRAMALGDVDSSTTLGLQERYDTEYVDRRHTKNRVVLSACNDGFGAYSIGDYVCTADQVQLNDVAPYLQNTTHWLSWLRSTLGLRADDDAATDHSLIQGFTRGSAAEYLLQPKGNLAFGPWSETEFYISAGKGFHSDDIRGVLGTVPLQGVPFAIGRVPLMAKTVSEEIGLRTASMSGLQIQVSAFRQDYSSELIYDQDAGQDQATAPSRRQGFEISAEYRPFPWIELNTDFAATHARFFKNEKTLDNFYGIIGGASIANAPDYVASCGILVDNLGPWFGGLQERILGPYPLTNGAASPGSDGYKETNLDIGYKATPNLTAKLTILNLFNSKAYAAEFYYATDINAREVAHYGTVGVNDEQIHPLEPIAARLSLTMTF